MLNMIVWTVI